MGYAYRLTIERSPASGYAARLLILASVGALSAVFVFEMFVATLASRAGPYRWPALGFALGAALILGEIILAEVLLSQIGNVILLIAGTVFARLLLRGDPPS